MDPVRLCTDGLELSEPTADDLDAITVEANDSQVGRFTTLPIPYRRSDAEHFVSVLVPQTWADGGGLWVLRTASGFAGVVGLHPRNPGVCEIGYWAAAAARGAGLMTRAIRLVVDFGFEELQLRRLEWRAVEGNWASWKPAWRAGFRREGVLRAAAPDRFDPSAPDQDLWLAGLLATDPRVPATPWDGPKAPAGPILTSGPRTAEHPRPLHVLAHLSDCHLRHPERPLVSGKIDPRATLADLLAGLAVSGHRPEALLFTGDLSDDGTPESYLELRQLVEPVAADLGCRVIWLNGNHDDRATFRTVLLDQAGDDTPVNQVHWLGGLRVICLDSTVPGKDHGLVADGSLSWLADQLGTPAPEGTLLLIHHAPLPVVQDLAAAWELLDQASLARVLAGSDVRAILAGHFHQSSFGAFAGIPVSAATSTCYTQDLFTGRGIRGQDGAQGCSLVHVHADSVQHTVVPIGRWPGVMPERDAEASATELERRGVRITERHG